MPVPSPIVLSVGLIPRFIAASEVPGATHTVVLHQDDPGFTLPTYTGGQARTLPSADVMEMACRVGRRQAYADEWNAAHRYPLAANLNNLAVVRLLAREWTAAEEAVNEAVENFDAISKCFVDIPVPAAIQGISVARYNLGVVCYLIQNNAGGRGVIADALSVLSTVSVDRRDADFDLVESALTSLRARFA